ncbi:hypothetical protein [Mesobacterium pallidum]|uniref:hypothetical protein n=1 Tax=Mesobacterium pallidum TaxID=2872037 RepID=UPI001EE2B2E6|nr:hypothetical protein [Mesobacterium pallidum]
MRNLLFAIATGLALASPVQAADPVTNGVVAQLSDQGYRRIVIGKTFLGRMRIVATSGSERREIILDPRSGEILRDLTQREDGTRAAPRLVHSGGSGPDRANGARSESGGSSSDDEGEDDGGTSGGSQSSASSSDRESADGGSDDRGDDGGSDRGGSDRGGDDDGDEPDEPDEPDHGDDHGGDHDDAEDD